MPIAIQYGMSEQQFWHGDIRLLSVYQKAYLTDKSYTAWQNGQYNFIAQSFALSNMWAKNKSQMKEYPKWENPCDKLFEKKEIITRENLEMKFRQDMIKQQSWLKNILKIKE